MLGVLLTRSELNMVKINYCEITNERYGLWIMSYYDNIA